jgi:hypothetical protein
MMGSVVLPLIELAAKLAQLGIDAYHASQDQHSVIVAKFEAALMDGASMVEKLKSAHAQRLAEAQAAIDALKPAG